MGQVIYNKSSLEEMSMDCNCAGLWQWSKENASKEDQEWCICDSFKSRHEGQVWWSTAIILAI
jgi:hypothetical protein